MKFKITVLFSLLLIAGCSGAQETVESEQAAVSGKSEVITDKQVLLSYQDQITVEFLRNHLTAFAADSMKGRETGTPGIKKAARFLVDQYQQMNLQPAGVNNTYFQPFDLRATVTDSVVFTTYTMNADGSGEQVGKSVSSTTTSANYIRQIGGTNTIKDEVVFAGFGLQDSTLNINHLDGVDLQGKWVMVYEDIPQVVGGDTLYTETQFRQFIREWLENIVQKGVAGILMIPDMNMNEFQQAAEEKQKQFGEPSSMQLAYRARENNEQSLGFNEISPEQAAEILELSEGTEGLSALKEEISQNISGFTPKKTGFGLKQTPYVRDIIVEAKNVAALLEGADPQLKDQIVVLTAHYDHVGVGQPDSTGDTIYNGADDDGSGTVTMLNIAHALAEARKNGVRPRRSILFLHVSAEEKGLLGSRYYSDHPIFPIENTVANLNIDMIGRIDARHKEKGITDYSYIIGGEIISSELDSLLIEANTETGNLVLSDRYNDLNDPNQFYRRSDHWNFGRLGVPFIFFFTGVHQDYHRPSDEVEKIRFEKLAQIGRTIYGTTILVANTDDPPQVDNQEFIEITQQR